MGCYMIWLKYTSGCSVESRLRRERREAMNVVRRQFVVGRARLTCGVIWGNGRKWRKWDHIVEVQMGEFVPQRSSFRWSHVMVGCAWTLCIPPQPLDCKFLKDGGTSYSYLYFPKHLVPCKSSATTCWSEFHSSLGELSMSQKYLFLI